VRMTIVCKVGMGSLYGVLFVLFDGAIQFARFVFMDMTCRFVGMMCVWM